jgi:signal transduction histidine kinase
MITEAEERLRREIAELLHGRVQNRLLIISYRLEEAQRLLDADVGKVREVLTEIRLQLEAIREQEVRELSHRLHPSIIRAGLLPALETLAEEMSSLEVSIEADEAVLQLDDPSNNHIAEPVRLTAYRVVEEALGNAVKHAGATRVQVELRVDDGVLEVQVADNGRGFVPAQSHPGLGLGSIAARVGRLGGTWSIHSAPGAGTRLSVRLPYALETGAQTVLPTDTRLSRK